MPAFDDELARAIGRSMVGADEAVQRPTLLLAEDEVLVRIMIADELRNAGFRVIEVSNADEALDVLRHDSVDVRALFSDVRMPGTIDGAQLAHIVRSEFPHLKVVLTSGNSGSIEWPQHDGFFRKPYQLAQVIGHLNALLNEGTPLGHVR
jgi:CheY-like chemotaxis protein